MRQLLRVGATLVALIAGSLALIAVAPAAHAAVTPLTLSQSSATVTEGHTKICTKDGVQAPSSWFRQYSLDTAMKDDQAFSVNSVSFGAEAFPRTVGVKVRLYHYPKGAELTWAGLQAAPPPVEMPWAVQPQPTSGGYVTAKDELTGFFNDSFRRSEDMVVEIFYPGGVPGEQFKIGSNAELVTGYSFLRSAGCDANRDGKIDELDNEIIPTWPLSPGNPMQVVIDVNGDIVPVHQQTVTASFDADGYKVFGEVSTGGLCTGNVRVGLYDARGALIRAETAKASVGGSPRTYDIFPSQSMPEGTRLHVVADGYTEPDQPGCQHLLLRGVPARVPLQGGP